MKKLVNTEEMAEILGISYESLKKICQREISLPRVKISQKALRFKPNEVINYFKNKEALKNEK